MRKTLFVSLFVLMLFLVGCQKKPALDPEQNPLYIIAVDYGYKGTYAEWLGSIKNDLGIPGDNIEFSVIDGYIKWKNTNEDQWYNLVSLIDLIGKDGNAGIDGVNGKDGSDGIDGKDGSDGTDGLDGREIIFKVEDGYIKWQYELDDTWNNLIALELLTGNQGISILYVEINESGELIISYSDGSNENLGKIINTYQVQFKDYNGYILDIQNILPGHSAIEPEVPDRIGYEFIGWNLEFDNILADIEIYAIYEIKTYTITFYDDKYEVYNVLEIEHGSTLDLGVFNKNYYEFAGWFLGKTVNAEQFFETTLVTKDLSLYPKLILTSYPTKYVYAKDSDFLGNADGEFVYIGYADYVIIPEYIKGIKITSASKLGQTRLFSERNDIKGVIFEGKYNITNMDNLFFMNTSLDLELTYLTTTNVTSMIAMFSFNLAQSLDLSSFDTSKVTTMKSMFALSKATEINVKGFNTVNVTDMSNMFSSAEVLNLDLSSFNTRNVTTMQNMFVGLKALNINLSSFNTSNVTSMNAMFYNTKLTSIDVSDFDTSNVTTMQLMFAATSALELDLSNFNTSNVVNMTSMFEDSNALTIDLSSFDTSNVNNMVSMFKNSKAQVLDLSSFDTTNVSNRTDMFLGSEATLGYARNQEEADIFNLYKNIFIVKP